MNNQQSRPGGSPAFKISNEELTEEQLRDVERRLDHMLDVAWAVYQTISTDPKRLAALRRYLTDVRNGSRIGESGTGAKRRESSDAPTRETAE